MGPDGRASGRPPEKIECGPGGEYQSYGGYSQSLYCL